MRFPGKMLPLDHYAVKDDPRRMQYLRESSIHYLTDYYITEVCLLVVQVVSVAFSLV